jgi:phage recombination protein Bet
MTAVATRPTTNNTALSINDGQTEFTPGQVATLRQLGVDNATREDLAVFFHVVRRTGLDPFARQIYMVGRWSKQGTKFTIQTGIDGYRLIARRAVDRTRETLGYEDTVWCGEDGQWREVWLSKEPPAAAKVTVLRNGERYPAVALFTEYAQTTKDGGLTQMWREKGALMIAKCAEALALRKAFPQDLSGIYTAEEMAQADNEQPFAQAAPAPAEPQRTVTRQRKRPEPQPEPQPVQGEVDWYAEVDLANGDFDAIRAIYGRARSMGASEAELEYIKQAGDDARAKATVETVLGADALTGELVEDEPAGATA